MNFTKYLWSKQIKTKQSAHQQSGRFFFVLFCCFYFLFCSVFGEARTVGRVWLQKKRFTAPKKNKSKSFKYIVLISNSLGLFIYFVSTFLPKIRDSCEIGIGCGREREITGVGDCPKTRTYQSQTAAPLVTPSCDYKVTDYTGEKIIQPRRRRARTTVNLNETWNVKQQTSTEDRQNKFRCHWIGWRVHQTFSSRYGNAARSSHIDGSGLPDTRAVSANQSVTNNLTRRKPKEWPPRWPHKLKHSNRSDYSK